MPTGIGRIVGGPSLCHTPGAFRTAQGGEPLRSASGGNCLSTLRAQSWGPDGLEGERAVERECLTAMTRGSQGRPALSNAPLHQKGPRGRLSGAPFFQGQPAAAPFKSQPLGRLVSNDPSPCGCWAVGQNTETELAPWAGPMTSHSLLPSVVLKVRGSLRLPILQSQKARVPPPPPIFPLSCMDGDLGLSSTTF